MQKNNTKGFDGLYRLDTGIDEILNENDTNDINEKYKNNASSDPEKENRSSHTDFSNTPDNKSEKSGINGFFVFLFFVVLFVVIEKITVDTTNDNFVTKNNHNANLAKVESKKESSYSYSNINSFSNSKPKQFLCQEVEPSSTILDINELCYCLAEQVRIKAAAKLINHYSTSSVNKYNQMVDNYNRKCNHKKYYHKDWDKANNYIQKHKSQYESEGKYRMYIKGQNRLNYSNSDINRYKNRKYSLTIKTIPFNAKVQIMNIKPKYYDGIKLKNGKYDIRVSKKGYKTVRAWIELNKDEYFTVTLQKN